MFGNRKVLESLDRHFDLAERRLDADAERIDAYARETRAYVEETRAYVEQTRAYVAETKARIERSNEESQMNRQFLADLLKQSRESHREVMREFKDIGVDLREQTQALRSIRAAVDPEDEK